MQKNFTSHLYAYLLKLGCTRICLMRVQTSVDEFCLKLVTPNRTTAPCLPAKNVIRIENLHCSMDIWTFYFKPNSFLTDQTYAISKTCF